MRADSILATIGNTPHVRLSRLFPDHEVWVKNERANPGGSIKDRIALAMIEDAEQQAALLGRNHPPCEAGLERRHLLVGLVEPLLQSLLAIDRTVKQGGLVENRITS